MQTFKEICDEIYKVDEKTGKVPLRHPTPITQGMLVKNPPIKEGLVQITPEQALGIYIERLSVNGEIEGYQRVQALPSARQIARLLRAGGEIPEVSLALDSGRVFADDGATRILGCIIARKPIWAVIRKRDYSARKKRFASQHMQRRISADVLALANDGIIFRYIQEAVVARKNGQDHPWARIVGAKNSSIVMSPHVAVLSLTNYVLAIRGNSSMRPEEERLRSAFSADKGIQLARVLLAFGTKSTNPLAFRPFAIRAITDAAVMIVAREGYRESDVQRWERHMVSFDWSGYAWVRSSRELATQLIRHWNKRLGPDSRIAESG